MVVLDVIEQAKQYSSSKMHDTVDVMEILQNAQIFSNTGKPQQAAECYEEVNVVSSFSLIADSINYITIYV